ncbi:melanotransferrin-like [Diadema antillarum]|uniref:melanotransferrin-like n=1 Tax=Diadema antillarum TaxID=105358 RepID=UPI003A8C6909
MTYYQFVKMSSRDSIIALILLFAVAASSFSEAATTQMRWCTISAEEEGKCAEMKDAFQTFNMELEVVCYPGTDLEYCYEAIQEGRADLITLNRNDLYDAGRYYGLVPIVQEVYSSEPYHGIAVVRVNDTEINITNLKGKKSCHTGVRRTAGWVIPVGFLLYQGYMDPVDCGDDVNAVAQFFSESCAPGAFTAARDPYGTNPANLCGICTRPDCPPDSNLELYNSYEGALRCLVEEAGDVAFIKPSTLEENTGLPPGNEWNSGLDINDFRLLCPDGTRGTIDDSDTCSLAQSAADGIVTSGTTSEEDILAFQDVLQDAAALFGPDDNTNGFKMFDSGENSNLLFSDSTQSLLNLEIPQTYRTFLGDYANSLDGLNMCPPDTLRWCTTSIDETRKCRSMKAAFTAAGLTPELACYEEEGAAVCMDRIAADEADVITVDGGDLYTGGREEKIVPVAGEDYGDGDASYWAVAVARTGTQFGIDDLDQRLSCHTGIGKTSGWNVPVGQLIKQGDIVVDDACNVPKAVGNFFEQSCAPGAKSSAYDPNGDNPSSLCDLCIGEGENNCARSAVEPYYDYSGAFRCLAESAGDVAFVKHTTVPDNTDLQAPGLGWNDNLRSVDYELLCLDGTRAPVDQWMTCNLAKVPSHTVVTAITKTDNEKQEIWNLLNQGQTQFGSDTGNQFKMFDSADFGGSDLLFKDSTESLLHVGDRDTYDTWLSEEYLSDLDALYCATGGAERTAQFSFAVTIVAVLFQALWLGVFRRE